MKKSIGLRFNGDDLLRFSKGVPGKEQTVEDYGLKDGDVIEATNCYYSDAAYNDDDDDNEDGDDDDDDIEDGDDNEDDDGGDNNDKKRCGAPVIDEEDEDEVEEAVITISVHLAHSNPITLKVYNQLTPILTLPHPTPPLTCPNLP